MRGRAPKVAVQEASRGAAGGSPCSTLPGWRRWTLFPVPAAGPGQPEPLPGGAELFTLSEEALLVRFPGGLDGTAYTRVRALDRRLAEQRAEAVREWVPAYDSLLILHQPGAEGREPVARFLRQHLAAALDAVPDPPDPPAERIVEVPTCYGGEAGPDLPAVSALLGLSQEEVIRLHSATLYRCYLLGFMPGFPYLGPVPKALLLPRLAHPRGKVPAGSVGLAGRQTGIYPFSSPAGWHIIGRTHLRLFDPARDDPFLIHPGDRVRFVPVGPAGGEATVG